MTHEEAWDARLGTHVGADLGHSRAQVEHGGDGANGKSNDFSPGERLQGRDRDRASPCVQSPSTGTPSPACAQLSSSDSPLIITFHLATAEYPVQSVITGIGFICVAQRAMSQSKTILQTYLQFQPTELPCCTSLLV